MSEKKNNTTKTHVSCSWKFTVIHTSRSNKHGGIPTLSWDNEIVFFSSAMLQRGGDETTIDTSAKNLTHEADCLEYLSKVSTSSLTLKRRLPKESNDLNTAAVVLGIRRLFFALTV